MKGLLTALLVSAALLGAGCELIDMSRDSADETYTTSDNGQTTVIRDGNGNVVQVITNSVPLQGGTN